MFEAAGREIGENKFRDESLSLGGVGNSGEVDPFPVSFPALLSFSISCSNVLNLNLVSFSSLYNCDRLFEFAPLVRNDINVTKRLAFGREIGSGFIIL